MNRMIGTTLASCIRQNSKYNFEGLKGFHSSSSEFQSLARSVYLPWHHIYFAEHLAEKQGKGDRTLLRWLIAHILYQSGSGHLRTDLSKLDADLELWFRIDRESFPGTEEEYADSCRRIGEIKDDLKGSFPEVIGDNPAIFGTVEGKTPFLCLPGRNIVYLRNFHKMEMGLLDNLSRLSVPEDSVPDGLEEKLRLTADKLETLGVEGINGPAIETALKLLNRRFVILSGGPGTGKTTTVTALLRILRMFEQEDPGYSAGRIALAAPTGRAANRMIESLRLAVEKCPLPLVDTMLPVKAGTLHKLLGINPSRRTVKFNRERPIPAELVILDEASMVDARMMSLLFDALAPGASLLLVGDCDQLPSVDAGAVFGDFVAHSDRDSHKLKESILFLTRSWRSSSGILEAASAVIRGEGEETLEILSRGTGDLHYGTLPSPDKIVDRIIKEYGLDNRAVRKNPEELFGQFEKFAVLIPSRKGLIGVENLNRRINSRLSGRNSGFYHGQPIMVLNNDYDLSLFNGDRGIIIRKGTEYFAVFRNGLDDFRYIPAGKLGLYETSYCQTVHKSQGSEYEKVLFLIPEGAERLLTREIVYTGITRAKKELTILSADELIRESLERIVVRHSGIREFLGGEDEIGRV